MGSFCMNTGSYYFDFLWPDSDSHMYALVDNVAYHTNGKGSYWSGDTGGYYCYKGIDMYAYDTSTFKPAVGNWVALRGDIRAGSPASYDGYKYLKNQMYRLIWKTEAEADSFTDAAMFPALCVNANSAGDLDARAFNSGERTTYMTIYKRIVQDGDYTDTQGRNYPWYLDSIKTTIYNTISDLSVKADAFFSFFLTNGNVIYSPKWNSDYYTPYLNVTNNGHKFVKVSIAHYGSDGTLKGSSSGIIPPHGVTSGISYPTETEIGKDADYIYITTSYADEGTFNRIYMRNYNIKTYFDTPTSMITSSTYTLKPASSQTASNYYKYTTTKSVSSYSYGFGIITTVKNSTIFGNSYPYKQIYKPYYDQSISVGETVIIPGSIVSQCYTFNWSGSGAWTVYPRKILENGSTYSGYKVLDTCVAVKSNCNPSLQITYSGIAVPNDNVFYAMSYYNTFDDDAYAYYQFRNNSSSDINMYCKVDGVLSSLVVPVPANAAVGLRLTRFGTINPGSEVVFYTKDNVKIKTAENTFSDMKKMYIKTASDTLSEAKAIYLKTTDGWKQVM